MLDLPRDLGSLLERSEVRPSVGLPELGGPCGGTRHVTYKSVVYLSCKHFLVSMAQNISGVGRSLQGLCPLGFWESLLSGLGLSPFGGSSKPDVKWH